MCGICGWLAPRGLPIRDLEAMNNAAEHRGPDGEGYWIHNGTAPTGRFRDSLSDPSGEATVALGHRRLAILDLSSAGAQPMASPDRRLWIVPERRDLQLPRAPRGTEEGRAPVHQLDRHRGGARGLLRVGNGLLRAVQRHVGAGHRRLAPEHARPLARPPGHQAVVRRQKSTARSSLDPKSSSCSPRGWSNRSPTSRRSSSTSTPDTTRSRRRCSPASKRSSRAAGVRRRSTARRGRCRIRSGSRG